MPVPAPPTGLGTCGQCKFYTVEDPDDVLTGSCRYRPPVAVGIVERIAWQWPQCRPDDWCGEWTAIPAP